MVEKITKGWKQYLKRIDHILVEENLFDACTEFVILFFYFCVGAGVLLVATVIAFAILMLLQSIAIIIFAVICIYAGAASNKDK